MITETLSHLVLVDSHAPQAKDVAKLDEDQKVARRIVHPIGRYLSTVQKLYNATYKPRNFRVKTRAERRDTGTRRVGSQAAKQQPRKCDLTSEAAFIRRRETAVKRAITLSKEDREAIRRKGIWGLKIPMDSARFVTAACEVCTGTGCDPEGQENEKDKGARNTE
jgi:hypothetical protein